MSETLVALTGTNTINSTEYRIWASMIQRCTNPKNRAYRWYGARGIKVCDRWKSFDNFYADMGIRPPNLTLDRKNNDGNLISIVYEGEIRYLVDVCEEINFSYKMARQRYHRRWLDSELFLPPQQGNQWGSLYE